MAVVVAGFAVEYDFPAREEISSAVLSDGHRVLRVCEIDRLHAFAA